MRAISALLGLCIATVLLGGCAGNGGGGASTGATATEGASQVDGGTSPTASSQTTADELPAFMSDFDRVCETQVGFSGAAAYEASPGLHPVVLFKDYGDPPSLIQASVTFPAGWTITEDADYSNNSELAEVQLVACSRRVDATPNGTTCDFEPSDGSDPITLELTDTAYELTVFAAATGEQVGETQRLEASTSECPYFATFKRGRHTIPERSDRGPVRERPEGDRRSLNSEAAYNARTGIDVRLGNGARKQVRLFEGGISYPPAV